MQITVRWCKITTCWPPGASVIMCGGPFVFAFRSVAVICLLNSIIEGCIMVFIKTISPLELNSKCSIKSDANKALITSLIQL